MPNSTIWVVVASESRASIRASVNGASHQIQSVSNSAKSALPGHARCRFACNLMVELCRGELAHAFDGLIVVADAEMMRDLQCFMTKNVSRRVIAEIVTEVPDRYLDTAFAGEALTAIENYAFL